MCQTVILSICTMLVIIGLYFTSYAPTCLYTLKDSENQTCPDSFIISGSPYKSNRICENTICIYKGDIGTNQTNETIQAFCHWTNPAVELFGIFSIVGFFIATVFSLGIYYKNKTFTNRITMAIVATISGILGLITAIMAYIDVGKNGCSNQEFQTLFNGPKTPGVHYAWATLELIMGLALVGAAVIASIQKKEINIEKLEVENLRNSLITS